MISPQGKSVVITGAARGLGAAVARSLAAAGADLALLDAPATPATSLSYKLSGADELAAVAAEVTSLGRRCVAKEVDLRDREATAEAVESAAASLGRIDWVVSAAGVRSGVLAEEMSDDAWADVVETNLHGLFHLLQAAVPTVERSAGGHGRVVIVSAEEGRRGAAMGSHYAAAAWSVIGLAKSVALEHAAGGLAVNVVCPSAFESEMLGAPDVRASLWQGPRWRRSDHLADDGSAVADLERFLAERQPTGQAFVSPTSIVDVIEFLLTRSTNDMTGSVIDVTQGSIATNSV